MKKSEMNENQLAVFNLVYNEANELVGGLENSIEDGDDEEGKKQALLNNHEALVNQLICWVKTSREWRKQDNLHLVTSAWMEERCEKRIKKMGY